MPPRARRDPGASRRVWIPLLAVAVIVVPAIWRMRNLPEAPPNDAPSASAASATVAPSAAPTASSPVVQAVLAERTITRARGVCQELKRGAPPRRVRCPGSLADGDVLELEPDATCRRVGASPGPVPCPMEMELVLPASASAAAEPSPPPPKPPAERNKQPPPGATHGR